MNIKFLNGTNFNYLNAVETEEYYNGASRRTLTFEAEVGVIGVDELNGILSDENNTKSITLTGAEVAVTDAEGNPTGEYTRAVNIYDGYVLKCKCGIENKLVQAETPETAAVYADRIIFKLAKRTYIEEMLHRLGL